ncbi:MAG TPA: hypothetical protein VFJ24_08375, partial [Gaiellales bacterium]|nr:hypothetical protein [Gaiellales bacterium]
MWTAHYEPWGKSTLDAWDRVHRTHAFHLLAHFGHLSVERCDYSAADAYVARRRAQKVRARGTNRFVHPTTIDHELATAKACLNWAIKRKLVERNPLDRYAIRLTREDLERMSRTHRKFAITEEEFVKLLEAAQPKLIRLMICFPFETGLRRDEYREMVDDEVDEKHGLLRLPGHRVK